MMEVLEVLLLNMYVITTHFNNSMFFSTRWEWKFI